MSRAQGVHGSGSRSYTDEQRWAICSTMLRLQPGDTITVEELSLQTGIAGRTARQIVVESDGVDFLLGGDDTRGYTIAATRADADRKTKRLLSQASRMLERVNRRREMESAMGNEDE